MSMPNSMLGIYYALPILLLLFYFQTEIECAPPGVASLYDKFYHSRTGYLYARPVVNNSDPVIMYMNLSLVQILNVDEKNQIITLNMWVLQEWVDPFFQWEPKEYGNVEYILLPSEALWTPDLVLYTNSGGEWDLGKTSTKIKIYYNGRVVWKPPIIYESSCDINVEFFPFDIQDCKLKMGTWTYHGMHIDLRHLAQKQEDELLKRTEFDNCESDINYAIDLSEYVENTEWDLLQVSAVRNIEKYTCCPEPYLDITFVIRFQRSPIFYTINLIVPSVALSFLAVMVFYLPSDAYEKMTLSISILIALSVFMMLVFDLTPPTSFVIPLLTKYILFTMVLLSLSVIVSIAIINIRFSFPDVHKVPTWARRLFIEVLPMFVFMDCPDDIDEIDRHKDFMDPELDDVDDEDFSEIDEYYPYNPSPTPDEITNDDIQRAIKGIRSITKKIKDDIEWDNIEEEWKFIALVLDRLFLYIFGISACLGVIGIFFQAPAITQKNTPLRSEYYLEYEKNKTVTRNCSMADLFGK